MDIRECVAFMLVKDETFLAEKRLLTKAVDPGVTAIPGGHLESDEAPEVGLVRELEEELGVHPKSVRYVCTLLYESQELRRLNYYAIESWVGEMANNEAADLVWLPLSDPDALDLVVDRTAVREYLRLYRSEPGKLVGPVKWQDAGRSNTNPGTIV